MQVEITHQPIADAIPPHQSQADILIVPGLPDYQVPETDQALYPTNVADLVKIAREAGFSIDYADDGNRAYFGLKAAEVWIPIITFVNEAVAAGFGVVIGDWLRELIGTEEGRRTRLHVKVGKKQVDGDTVEWMTANGDADEVLQALETFLARPSGRD